jgi:hypothetical protein
MKPIKITPENATVIEQALHAVNGRATQHCYNTYNTIEWMALDGDKFLTGIYIPQKAWKGATRTETSGGKVANSYKYTRNATTVRIERRSSAWYPVEIRPATVFSNGGGRAHYGLTPEQDAIATEHFAQQYFVRQPTN